ncbi:hypothetical protein AURDEDRAFT_111457, partial [Auricularia subglabra TFB-10046 SS5]
MPASDPEHDRRAASPEPADDEHERSENASASPLPAPTAEPETTEPAEQPAATPSTDDKSADADTDADAAAAANAAEWQAVWSPPHNAYYFFNSRTQETTWINPLVPPSEADAADASTALVPASSSAELQPFASTSAQAGPSHDPYAAAIAAGIDPALAHLDPTLAYGATAPAGPMSFAAKFNARTGAFTKTDARTPDHLGEWERARRMSEMYFDVNKWEQEVADRKEQEHQDELEGKKRKRPSKKDLERFKEQKKRKMIAKTAWLRT